MRQTLAPLLICATASLAVACSPSAPAGSGAPEGPRRPVPTAEQAQAMLATLPEPYRSADLDNGRAVFARCRSCHTVTDGSPNMTGPNLYGVFGRQIGTHPGYVYSQAAQDAGFVWDAQHLDAWLQTPRTFLPGTKMSFAGIPDATDRRDVIAFIEIQVAPIEAAAPPDAPQADSPAP